MSSRVTTLLQELIRIPSVNPDGAPGAPHTGEARMARRVAEILERLGAQTTLEEVLPDRPNVIGRFPSHGGRKPRVVLGPHTDTVGVEGMTIDPFGGDIRDGRVHGRGASDTKGTLAAMLAALEELGAARLANLAVEVVFVGFIGEETGQHGSRHFAAHHPDHDFAIIGEPTRCAVVHTHKGCSWVTLETTGLACHGSQPERGRNAIHAMLPALEAVRTTLAGRLASPEWHHPVLGQPTVSLNVVRGGSRTNIVPDRCRAELDIRETPALHRYGTVRLVREGLDAAGLTEVSVSSGPPCPPLDTPTDNRFVRCLASLGAPLVGAPWLCDATWLAEKGIPSVAAGPGDIAQAHTADEFIEIAELERGVAFYRRFLEKA